MPRVPFGQGKKVKPKRDTEPISNTALEATRQVRRLSRSVGSKLRSTDVATSLAADRFLSGRQHENPRLWPMN